MSPRPTRPARTLPDTVGLDAFMARVGADPLPLADRYRLVTAARVLVEELYVHLPLKRARYATDPVQRLRLLERRVPALGELQFHAELAAVFRDLHDLHTVYQLPAPYRGQVAVLGFLVERYQDEDGTPHHVVSRIDDALRHGDFDAGVELELWNGVPVERAVERGTAAQAGCGPDARLARGLESLTLRPLRTAPPPDERWVLLTYRTPGGRLRETRIPWRVRAAERYRGRDQDPVPTLGTRLGIDAGNEATRQAKRALFAPGPARTSVARAPRDVLAYSAARARPYGYLRIYSFNVTSARRFAEQVAAIAARAPAAGLIVDVRGNPGGNILAAEAALRVLSTDPVAPVRFSLPTTRAALALVRADPALRRWTGSIRDAVESGEQYSQAFPLSDPDAVAEGLPRYAGPKVLIVDALTYSAADIFAAGFADNGPAGDGPATGGLTAGGPGGGIGPVLGTAATTGAGGANVWTYELLRVWLPELLGELPRGAGFRVALRRATRAGSRIGVPLEDFGVTADPLHRLTRRDVLGHNRDLLGAAAALLP
ncbi:S41 family peptidase [Kitasatospora purpeofusca]|uniref:S41 family peptidase n=1 Tax=Kitasatospora purpeofusca TaxID=67352 RepID=UPI002E121C5B|nr:S41 family peptidase [Kitasatospora purpeofusca]WSR29548.1 S41 family peptidase [Kitasatospora purpeofusca]